MNHTKNVVVMQSVYISFGTKVLYQTIMTLAAENEWFTNHDQSLQNLNKNSCVAMLMQQTAKIYLLTLDVNWRVHLQFSTLCSRNPMTRQPLFIYLFCHLKKKRILQKNRDVNMGNTIICSDWKKSISLTEKIRRRNWIIESGYYSEIRDVSGRHLKETK